MLRGRYQMRVGIRAKSHPFGQLFCIGTPVNFYKTATGLNKKRADRNGNILFLNTSLNSQATDTIALPNSSSNYALRYAIIPEGKQATEENEALCV